jgi:drug/metabolite transporter (DMT)-like permease
MSSPVASASPAIDRRTAVNVGGTVGSPPPDRRLRGYAEIGVASLILGTSATLIQVSTMPASLLVVLRMALAGIVLGALFLKTGGIAEVRRSGHFRRMVIVGFVVALELIFYFASIRLANVTVGISLEYMAPVFVALLAPWVLRTRRQTIDMVAVAVALGGMALLVLPGLTMGEGHTSIPGIIFGLLAGLMFATAMMLIKSMGQDVRGSTFALFFCLGSVVLLTPLALWQTLAGHYHLTWTDTWIVLVSGLIYTALCFSLFTDGIRHVRVEHAGILGYIEPVTSPLWAFLLIGETVPWTTLAGGALIVAAGILVIVLGKGEAEPLLEPLS